MKKTIVTLLIFLFLILNAQQGYPESLSVYTDPSVFAQPLPQYDSDLHYLNYSTEDILLTLNWTSSRFDFFDNCDTGYTWGGNADNFSEVLDTSCMDATFLEKLELDTKTIIRNMHWQNATGTLNQTGMVIWANDSTYFYAYFFFASHDNNTGANVTRFYYVPHLQYTTTFGTGTESYQSYDEYGLIDTIWYFDDPVTNTTGFMKILHTYNIIAGADDCADHRAWTYYLGNTSIAWAVWLAAPATTCGGGSYPSSRHDYSMWNNAPQVGAFEVYADLNDTVINIGEGHILWNRIRYPQCAAYAGHSYIHCLGEDGGRDNDRFGELEYYQSVRKSVYDPTSDLAIVYAVYRDYWGNGIENATCNGTKTTYIDTFPDPANYQNNTLNFTMSDLGTGLYMIPFEPVPSPEKPSMTGAAKYYWYDFTCSKGGYVTVNQNDYIIELFNKSTLIYRNVIVEDLGNGTSRHKFHHLELWDELGSRVTGSEIDFVEVTDMICADGTAYSTQSLVWNGVTERYELDYTVSTACLGGYELNYTASMPVPFAYNHTYSYDSNRIINYTLTSPDWEYGYQSRIIFNFSDYTEYETATRIMINDYLSLQGFLIEDPIGNIWPLTFIEVNAGTLQSYWAANFTPSVNASFNSYNIIQGTITGIGYITIDFAPTGTLIANGTIFFDYNSNGDFDSEDYALQNANLYLYNMDYLIDGKWTLMKNLTTDSNGFFHMTALDVADYRLYIDLMSPESQYIPIYFATILEQTGSVGNATNIQHPLYDVTLVRFTVRNATDLTVIPAITVESEHRDSWTYWDSESTGTTISSVVDSDGITDVSCTSDANGECHVIVGAYNYFCTYTGYGFCSLCEDYQPCSESDKSIGYTASGTGYNDVIGDYKPNLGAVLDVPIYMAGSGYVIYSLNNSAGNITTDGEFRYLKAMGGLYFKIKNLANQSWVDHELYNGSVKIWHNGVPMWQTYSEYELSVYYVTNDIFETGFFNWIINATGTLDFEFDMYPTASGGRISKNFSYTITNGQMRSDSTVIYDLGNGSYQFSTRLRENSTNGIFLTGYDPATIPSCNVTITYADGNSVTGTGIPIHDYAIGVEGVKNLKFHEFHFAPNVTQNSTNYTYELTCYYDASTNYLNETANIQISTQGMLLTSCFIYNRVYDLHTFFAPNDLVDVYCNIYSDPRGERYPLNKLFVSADISTGLMSKYVTLPLAEGGDTIHARYELENVTFVQANGDGTETPPVSGDYCSLITIFDNNSLDPNATGYYASKNAEICFTIDSTLKSGATIDFIMFDSDSYQATEGEVFNLTCSVAVTNPDYYADSLIIYIVSQETGLWYSVEYDLLDYGITSRFDVTIDVANIGTVFTGADIYCVDICLIGGTCGEGSLRCGYGFESDSLAFKLELESGFDGIVVASTDTIRCKASLAKYTTTAGYNPFWQDWGIFATKEATVSFNGLSAFSGDLTGSGFGGALFFFDINWIMSNTLAFILILVFIVLLAPIVVWLLRD